MNIKKTEAGYKPPFYLDQQFTSFFFLEDRPPRPQILTKLKPE